MDQILVQTPVPLEQLAIKNIETKNVGIYFITLP